MAPEVPFVPVSALYSVVGNVLALEWPKAIAPAQANVGSALRLRRSNLRYASNSLTVVNPTTTTHGIAETSTADPGPDRVLYVPPTPPFGTPLVAADGSEAPAFEIPVTITG